MAYIGRGTDKLSNIEKLDVITFDGSSSYTLQKNSVNFTPSSANNLQVSIDGVVQAGNFTVSGSTIDFGVAIPATSTNDFIFHYGTGLITTPADGTVSLAKLSATGTKDATTFLRGDNTFAEAGGGITEADQWRVTADITTDTNPISANLERVDTAGQGTLGTGMTESSGIFSFPSTGIYLVRFSSSGYTGTTDNFGFRIYATTNNSTYVEIAAGFAGHNSSNDFNVILESLVDVTDVANVKVKFEVYSITAGGGTHGSTTSNRTYFTFIRIGDT